MAVPQIPIAYVEETAASLGAPSVAVATAHVPTRQRRSNNWTRVVHGVMTLGEAVLVVLALPFIVLLLGVPIVLLVRLVIGIFQALF